MKKSKKERASSKLKLRRSQSTKRQRVFLKFGEGYPNTDEWLTVKGSYDICLEPSTSSSWLDEKLYFSFPSSKTYTTNTSL